MYKLFVWVVSGFLEMFIKNVFLNLKIKKKSSLGYTASYKTKHPNWCRTTEILLLENIFFLFENQKQAMHMYMYQVQYTSLI